MASPFDRFRKHQKKMLVFLGIFCMFSFVLGGIVCQPSGRSPIGGENAAVAETNSGTLYESDLRGLRGGRNLANFFFVRLQAEAGTPQGRFGQAATFGGESPREMMLLKLMNEKAEKLGLIVSDDSINAFIGQVTRGQLSSQEIGQIARNRNVSMNQVFRALRQELLAQHLQQMMFPGRMGDPDFGSTTPSQRWDYYLRLNRQAHIEALPIPVADFTDAVETPDEAVLQAYFQEYRDVLASPQLPTPGFRQPHQAAFQYLVADYDKYYDAELAGITDEDVKKHYEENLETFPYSGLRETPESETEEPVEAPPVEKPAEDSVPSSDDAKPEGTPEEKSDKPSENEGASAKELFERLRRETSPPRQEEVFALAQADEQPTTKADADDAKTEKDAAAKDDADAQPAKEDPAAEPKKDEAPQDDAKKDDTKTDDPAGGDAAKPDETPANPQESLFEIRDRYLPYLSIPEDIRDGPDPEHDPLWKVEESIRKLLARQQAQEKMKVDLDVIQQPMSDYSAAVSRNPDDPGNKPNLAKLADKYPNITLEPVTPLLSQRIIREEYDLGTTQLVGEQFSSNSSFTEAAYTALPIFVPAMAEDLGSNDYYLFWKVKDQPEFVPEKLDEVREQVVTAWKMEQARSAAETKAGELAESARSPGRSLSEVEFAGQTGSRIPPFTWMQPSQFPQFGMPPTISPAPGIDFAGDDFMQAVFRLEPGEVAVTFNQPKNTWYVVKLNQYGFQNGGDANLAHERFVAQMGMQDPQFMLMAQMEQQEQMRRWHDALLDEQGVKFIGPGLVDGPQ